MTERPTRTPDAWFLYDQIWSLLVYSPCESWSSKMISDAFQTRDARGTPAMPAPGSPFTRIKSCLR